MVIRYISAADIENAMYANSWTMAWSVGQRILHAPWEEGRRGFDFGECAEIEFHFLPDRETYCGMTRKEIREFAPADLESALWRFRRLSREAAGWYTDIGFGPFGPYLTEMNARNMAKE